MKLFYLNQVDQDDESHFLAVEAGHVPPECHAGGPLINLARSVNEDPCKLCPADARFRKAVCGGRERPLGGFEAAAVDASRVEELHSQTTAARKLERAGWIRQLTDAISATKAKNKANREAHSKPNPSPGPDEPNI